MWKLLGVGDLAATDPVLRRARSRPATLAMSRGIEPDLHQPRRVGGVNREHEPDHDGATLRGDKASDQYDTAADQSHRTVSISHRLVQSGARRIHERRHTRGSADAAAPWSAVDDSRLLCGHSSGLSAIACYGADTRHRGAAGGLYCFGHFV